MGFWSSIKNAVSNIAKNIVSGITRGLTKLVTFAIGFVIGALSSIFLFWATKKLRLHVCILQPLGGKELVSVSEAELAVERAAVLIRDKYNTKVRHYGSPYVEIVKEPAPDSALDTRCADSWTDAEILQTSNSERVAASTQPTLPVGTPFRSRSAFRLQYLSSVPCGTTVSNGRAAPLAC